MIAASPSKVRASGMPPSCSPRCTPSAWSACASRASSLTMNATPVSAQASRKRVPASRNAWSPIDFARSCTQAANGSSGNTRSSRRAGSRSSGVIR